VRTIAVAGTGIAAHDGSQSSSPRSLEVVMDAVSVAETPLPPIVTAALATAFSHVGEGDTPWRADGLRSFFLYRDLGVAEATNGQVIAQLVKANLPPEEGTGWHRHEAKFHIVLMLKG